MTNFKSWKFGKVIPIVATVVVGGNYRNYFAKKHE